MEHLLRDVAILEFLIFKNYVIFITLYKILYILTHNLLTQNVFAELKRNNNIHTFQYSTKPSLSSTGAYIITECEIVSKFHLYTQRNVRYHNANALK